MLAKLYLKWLVGCLIALAAVACQRIEKEDKVKFTVQNIEGLIPTQRKSQRVLWANAVHQSMLRLQEIGVPYTIPGACAVIAVIGQESSFQEETVVPGLAQLIRTKIEKKADELVPYVGRRIVRYVLDLPLLDQQHLANSSNKVNGATNQPAGSLVKDSIGKRLNQVKTEADLVRLLLNIGEQLHIPEIIVQWVIDHKVVKTVGPMQISAKFASQFGQRYFLQTPWATRQQLNTVEGAVLFGSAHLLHYQHQYDDWRYVFADYNAGLYASRNAGWQKTLSELTGQNIDLDGDLLRYPGFGQQGLLSQTQRALQRLPIGLPPEKIITDLQQEKTVDFEKTATYQTVNQLYAQRFGRPAPYALMPGIQLRSVKISRQLTTEWFADRVRTRHRECLSRAKKRGLE